MVELPNISSVAQSPDAEFNLRSQGKNFPTHALNSEESGLLQTQLEDLMAPFESSLLGNLISQRQDAIALTASFAKQVFDEKLFGGINAGDNEIAFDVLRPGQIFSDAGGTLHNDWYFEPGVTGGTTWTNNQTGGKWVDWIGDGTSGNNYTVGQDQVTVALAFMDQDVSTEVSGVNVDQFGRNVNMIPQDLNVLRLRDNNREQQIEPLPTLIAQENDEIHTKLRYDRQVESQPRLFGFTFGLGSFMNSEDF